MEKFRRLWKEKGKKGYTDVKGFETYETNLVYNIQNNIVCYYPKEIDEKRVITFFPLYINENGKYCIYANKQLVEVQFSKAH